MQKQMTITLDTAVYEGLFRTIDKSQVSQFIEDLLRPHVLGSALEEGYRAMAADSQREAAAQEWCNALVRDLPSETR